MSSRCIRLSFLLVIWCFFLISQTEALTDDPHTARRELQSTQRSEPIWTRFQGSKFEEISAQELDGSKAGSSVERDLTGAIRTTSDFLRSNSHMVCKVLIDTHKPAGRISIFSPHLNRTLQESYLPSTLNEDHLPTALNVESVSSIRVTNIAPRIVGGKFANPKLVQSAVAFYDPGLTQFICTGSLLSPKWVLVAAHCKIKPGYLVSLGSTQAGQDGFLFSVTRTYNHPRFKERKKTLLNDIAVVEILGGALPDSKFLQINSDAAVPTDNVPVRAIGFGRISSNNAVFDPKPLALRQVDILVAPAPICKAIYNSLTLKVFENMHICAGTPEGGCNVCSGDSGSPLLRYEKGKPIIVGITSYGTKIGCDVKGLPNVFTRVSKYLKWLKSTPAVFFTRDGVVGDNTKKCDFGQFVYFVSEKIKFCRDCPFRQVSGGGSTTSCRLCPNGLVRSTKDGRKCTCVGRLARGRGLEDGFCKECPAGTFSGTNNELCLLCQPGSFASRKGSFSCASCQPGTFSDNRGATFCKKCPPGQGSGIGGDRCFNV